MTNGELRLGDWWRVIRRELLMGACLGLFLGVLGYICAVGLMIGLQRAGPAVASLDVEEAREGQVAEGLMTPTARDLLVIPLTLMSVILCGTLCGGALPLVFRRMGFDPALMSNPFVAGIIDICGIVIYMTVALMMLAELS